MDTFSDLMEEARMWTRTKASTAWRAAINRHRLLQLILAVSACVVSLANDWTVASRTTTDAIKMYVHRGVWSLSLRAPITQSNAASGYQVDAKAVIDGRLSLWS